MGVRSTRAVSRTRERSERGWYSSMLTTPVARSCSRATLSMRTRRDLRGRGEAEEAREIERGEDLCGKKMPYVASSPDQGSFDFQPGMTSFE